MNKKLKISNDTVKDRYANEVLTHQRSASDLAKELGISPSRLSHIVKGNPNANNNQTIVPSVEGTVPSDPKATIQTAGIEGDIEEEYTRLKTELREQRNALAHCIKPVLESMQSGIMPSRLELREFRNTLSEMRRCLESTKTVIDAIERARNAGKYRPSFNLQVVTIEQIPANLKDELIRSWARDLVNGPCMNCGVIKEFMKERKVP